jgi:hypothetical protein
LGVRISIRARRSTLYDKVCQCLATGRWFSPVTPVLSTNKTDRHDIKHWQTLSYNVERLALIEIRTPNFTGDRHWLHTFIYCVFVLHLIFTELRFNLLKVNLTFFLKDLYLLVIYCNYSLVIMNYQHTWI